MSEKPTSIERENFHQLLDMAREEDLGTGDMTGKLLPADLRASAKFVARQPMVCCGGVFLGEVARAYSEQIKTELRVEEGKYMEAGDVLAVWNGPMWAIVAAERVALNFLQHLSGVATLARRFVNAIAGTDAKIYDTRKTTPGWRNLEKYAARVGGATNHRRGLYDAIMVKDNHLAGLQKLGMAKALEEIAPHLEQLRSELINPETGFVEVEVDTLDQLASALKLPVDVILVDNMRAEKLRQAVAMRNNAGLSGRVDLEASGGITLDTVREVAESGVERISVGSLTHSAPAVDIGLDIHSRL